MGSGQIRRTSPIHHHRYPTASIVLPPPRPALYSQAYSTGPKDILSDLKLPSGFFFGVAAAYQVEGAVKNEGKGRIIGIVHRAAHIPGVVWDNTTAVVDLHYYYKEDIASMGVNAHSFSPESTPSEQPTCLLTKPTDGTLVNGNQTQFNGYRK
ncbi:hypothetical protein BT96DRAFT_924923 [Gymnopus androsaceus JB14]|uniref:Uncharacterized protein n=1 Tax=Gymnopus androsaceus JB14 TaxID=1447944 RepID=A0A6A4H2Y0_9AGAR|nr:hypothetical protein BT96DRAFT_924923 [Gymnopus androsaceus JB14]